MASMTSIRWQVGAVCVAALMVCGATFGCQSSEQMRRPDSEVALERPAEWVRETDKESGGVHFQIRHQTDPVSVRLRAVEPAVITDGHRAWTLMWLEDRYERVEELESGEATLGGRDATRLLARVEEDEEPVVVEVHVANADGATYVLEAWGAQEALEESAQTRRAVAQSVELPEAGSDEAFTAEATEVAARSWRLTLPETSTEAIEADWRVESDDDRSSFALPSRLVEGRLYAERLPYPLEVREYARLALELDEAPEGSDDGVTVSREEGEGATAMVHSYRFVTRGHDAVQVVVSTPEALYETNRSLVDEILESLAPAEGETARATGAEEPE